MNEIRLFDGRSIRRLGMGCWAIGGHWTGGGLARGYGHTDDAESITAIRHALSLGVRFFDTADVYGAGHSEELLGEVVGERDDVVIATKIGNNFDPEAREATGALQPGPSLIGDVRRAIEASRRRLRRDRIDLIQLHLNSFPVGSAQVVFDILEELRMEGKIGAYGWSTDFPDRVEAFASRPHFVSVQHTMNVFFDAPTMMSVAGRYDLISINRMPLAMGLLTGKYRAARPLPKGDVRHNSFTWMDYFKDGSVAPEFEWRVGAVRELLTIGGRTMAQGALAWLWSKSNRTLPIPGFKSAAQVEENVGALEKGPLPANVMAEIENVIERAPEGEFRER